MSLIEPKSGLPNGRRESKTQLQMSLSFLLVGGSACGGFFFPASRTGTSERTKQWRERMQGSDKQSKLTLLVGANRMEAHHTYAKAFAEICEEDTEQELAVPVAESIHR